MSGAWRWKHSQYVQTKHTDLVLICEKTDSGSVQSKGLNSLKKLTVESVFRVDRGSGNILHLCRNIRLDLYRQLTGTL